MRKMSFSLSTCKISITCLLDDRYQTYIKYILHRVYIQNIIYDIKYLGDVCMKFRSSEAVARRCSLK